MVLQVYMHSEMDIEQEVGGHYRLAVSAGAFLSTIGMMRFSGGLLTTFQSCSWRVTGGQTARGNRSPHDLGAPVHMTGLKNVLKGF